MRRKRIEEKFLFADGETLAEAPPACTTAGCGGPWHEVDEGYGCVLCGRRWRAAACLRALVYRPQYHAYAFPGRASHQAQPRRRS
jgi:hypothetical protein